jgi:hypothetical protein
MKSTRAFLIVSLTLASCTGQRRTADYHPAIHPEEFQAKVDNPWFPLTPGTIYRYVERHGAERADGEVTVTTEKKVVMGVPCVVVHDRLSVGGTVLEDTYDWYAQDARGTVWYFGEDTKSYDDRGRVSTEGSWEAGIDGAEPGVMMYADPMPGPAYRTEYLRGEAEDMAQVMAFEDAVTVPAGRFAPALRTQEWSELEAGAERKWYAKGVGFVRAEADDGELTELVSVSAAP